MTIDPKHMIYIKMAVKDNKIIREMVEEVNDSMQEILVDIIKSEDIVMLNEYIDAMPSGWPRARLMDRVIELEKNES